MTRVGDPTLFFKNVNIGNKVNNPTKNPTNPKIYIQGTIHPHPNTKNCEPFTKPQKA